MQSTWMVTALTTTTIGLGVMWVATHRHWSEKYRRRLELAAGGEMSPAVLQAYRRRDRLRFRWTAAGFVLALMVWAVGLFSEGQEITTFVFALLACLALGQCIGNVRAAAAVIADTPTQRVASLHPRTMTDYVSRAQLLAERVSLLLPAGAALLALLNLLSPAPRSRLSLVILALSLMTLALGVVAPLLRRRLLRLPNTAQNKEASFWNNAIVSRAIGDVSVAVTLLSALTGLITFSTPAPDVLPGEAPAVAWTAHFVILIGVLIGPSLVTKDTNAIPTFITRNPPHARSAR